MYVCMYICMYVCMYVGVGTMSRGELPLRGDEPRTFTKGLKRIGTNQGVATSQLGGTHIHAMDAGGRFGTSVE